VQQNGGRICVFSQKVQLQKIVDEAMKIDTNKNWRWFGICMTKETQTNGLTWKYSKEGPKDWIRIGEMKDGNLHGWGVHIFLDGRKLVLGYSSKGVFYQATVLWENGATYVGQLDNVKNGWGVMTWTDGNRYQGEWKDDKREGNGILIWANGSKYDGEWRSSKIEGKGLHTLPNGDTLNGDWRNGKAHGHCHMILKSIGFESEGEWSNGEPNDEESCIHPSLRKCLEKKMYVLPMLQEYQQTMVNFSIDVLLVIPIIVLVVGILAIHV